MSFLRYPFITAIVLLAGCSETLPEGYSEHIVDGIVEHLYDHAPVPTLNPFEVQLKTVFGEEQGADSYFIGGLMRDRLARSDDGILFLYDRRQNLIHRFDNDGTYLGNFGREGEGPGEFRALTSLTMADDELITYDTQNRRVSMFTVDGRFVRDQTLDVDIRPFKLIPWASKGAIGYVGYQSMGIIFPGGSEERYQYAIYTLDSEAVLLTTPIDTVFTYTSPVSGRRTYRTPYSRTSAAVAAAPGLPVAWCQGNDYEVNLLHPESSRSERLRLLRERTPVTREMRELVFQRYAQRGDEEAARRTLRFPAMLPEIDMLLWDDEGRLWVRDYVVPQTESKLYTYNVFTADLRWLFRQSLPPQDPNLICSDGVFLYAEDAEGNPTIEFYILIQTGN